MTDKIRRLLVLAPVLVTTGLAMTTDWRFALGVGLLSAWGVDVYRRASR